MRIDGKVINFLKVYWKDVLLACFIPTIIILSYMLLISVPEVVDELIKRNQQIRLEMQAERLRADLEFIREDIEMYGYISKKLTSEIVESIKINSKKYHIPVGLLHAIFRVESDYKFFITHPKIMVKGKETAAIGLGGIVYEYWMDSLKTRDIIETKMDLYLPNINIEASAFILRILVNEEVNKSGNLLDRIITRYYGAYSEMYKDKTIRITSDLWIKKMIKELKNTGKVKI